MSKAEGNSFAKNKDKNDLKQFPTSLTYVT